MSRKFELLVFDWDGTLMDSQQEIISCFQWATRDLEMRIPTDLEIRNIIGLGMFQAIQALFPELDTTDKQQTLVDRYRHYYFSPQKPPSELFEGVFDMLNNLQAQGYFLAVATGKGRRGLDQVLERTKLDKVFHYTRCVDEAHSKPHPQMLLDVMDYLGVDNKSTLMIGDTEYDLLMASNANVQSAAVTCGAHEKHRLLQHDPLVCMNSPHELEQWLSNL
ncbi:MAG: HAD-IA family hydrolase [Gammaproteobacteria bacterium]|nr:HAD-IA family hydrolase [Gammaproteobacteria bacterium]